MSSLLQSTRNTRALPTGTMRYIRSDAPENLTDKDVQWLLDNNIITIVDLRSMIRATIFAFMQSRLHIILLLVGYLKKQDSSMRGH